MITVIHYYSKNCIANRWRQVTHLNEWVIWIIKRWFVQERRTHTEEQMSSCFEWLMCFCFQSLVFLSSAAAIGSESAGREREACHVPYCHSWMMYADSHVNQPNKRVTTHSWSSCRPRLSALSLRHMSNSEMMNYTECMGVPQCLCHRSMALVTMASVFSCGICTERPRDQKRFSNIYSFM